MAVLDTRKLGYREINEYLKKTREQCLLTGCLGQRFIAAGMAERDITVDGIPGNALGAYLNGANITVNGNAQDAVGDTMNEGSIIVHGNIGDCAGYAMRGGRILVKGSAGYRAGIHMKEYQEKKPLLVIGGTAGSFLGEYQAGGVIVVLGLHPGNRRIVHFFPCTGMHGGKIFLRSDCRDVTFPDQVSARPATGADLRELRGYVEQYCEAFGSDPEAIMDAPFTLVTPDSSNPYHQMYVAN